MRNYCVTQIYGENRISVGADSISARLIHRFIA